MSPTREGADETAELFSGSEDNNPPESAAMEGESDHESSPEPEREEPESHTPKAFGDTPLRKRPNPFKVGMLARAFKVVIQRDLVIHNLRISKLHGFLGVH